MAACIDVPTQKHQASLQQVQAANGALASAFQQAAAAQIVESLVPRLHTLLQSLLDSIAAATAGPTQTRQFERHQSSKGSGVLETAPPDTLLRAIEPVSQPATLSSSQSPPHSHAGLSQRTPGSSQAISSFPSTDQLPGEEMVQQLAEQHVRQGLIQQLVSAVGPLKSRETSMRSANAAMGAVNNLQALMTRRLAALEWLHEQELHAALGSQGNLMQQPVPAIQVRFGSHC